MCKSIWMEEIQPLFKEESKQNERHSNIMTVHHNRWTEIIK